MTCVQSHFNCSWCLEDNICSYQSTSYCPQSNVQHSNVSQNFNVNACYTRKRVLLHLEFWYKTFALRQKYCLSSISVINCNCYYILFTKLPLSGDSEVTLRSSSQAASCLRHTVEASLSLHCLLLIAERQAGKL